MARRARPWFWKARRTWYVTLDGVRHNLGPDKEAAWDQFHALMRKPSAKRVASKSIVGLIDRFLDWVKSKRAPDTFEWYRYRLQRFAERYPDLQVSELRPFHVEEWVESYPDLSQTSRRNYIRSVKRCIRWAKRLGYIDENPIAELEAPVAERKETFISKEEYEQLLGYIRDDSLRQLVVVTWETGCRPQESLRVEARHVDIDRKRWVLPTQESKGKKKPRVIYLTDVAFEITQALVDAHPNGPLFRNAAGEPWSTDAVNCGFDRIRMRMGQDEMSTQGIEISDDEITELIPTLKPTRVSKGKEVRKTESELRKEAKKKLRYRIAKDLAPRYSLYALRHSWATRALESGLDGLTVAILMGHSDPSTLARVYQHLSHNPEHLAKQVRKATG
ncbi:tyrosine-type recombinase/integrase [bacterium]|nr:tyrosine-type recombinase/integrase [bacterium]